MGQLVTANCPNCHKKFSYFPSAYESGKKIYCSRACQSQASRNTAICPECGKTFWYYKSWPRKYCSRKCSAANNAIKNLGVIEISAIYCEICGKEILNNRWVGRRFCSQNCFGKYLKQTQTGKPRPEVKGERPDLQKRVDITCEVCGKVFRLTQVHAIGRHCCSRKCSSRLQQITTAGANNFNWKGGYDPYYGPNWRQQRRNARYRDGYACRICGKTEAEAGKEHDVHHIKPFREFGIENYQKANHLSNLITLCDQCHRLQEVR